MKPGCRALGAEDLEPGARFCWECFRYKSKPNQCVDFRQGGYELVKEVTNAKGKTRWEKKRVA